MSTQQRIFLKTNTHLKHAILYTLLIFQTANSFISNKKPNTLPRKNIIHQDASIPFSCNINLHETNARYIQEQVVWRNRCVRRGMNSKRRNNQIKLFSQKREQEVNANISSNRIMNPLIQVLLVSVAYILHLVVLTQQCLAFPIQLIPNNKGHFQSIGYDSLAGIISILCYISYNKKQKPYPWKLQKEMKLLSSSVRAFTYLLIAYGMTGKFSILFEDIFYILAGMGMPLTIASHRSLVVLFGHLLWVAIGSLILHFELKTFFKHVKDKDTTTTTTTNDNGNKWFNCSITSNWVWWVIGGYFASSFIFNVSDFCNQMVLPASLFDGASEGVVSQLINPENNDKIAGFIGYIAPCISAPWWEELLYRGFMLPALNLVVPFYPSVIISGLIFSAHHLSTTGFIPLAMLGMTWAYLYAKCGNLFVTIFIHALWNSRVFLGSWFGL